MSPALPGDVNVNRCSKPSAGEICEEMMEAPLWWVELCYASNGDSNGTVCGNRGQPTPIFTLRANIVQRSVTWVKTCSF